MGANDKVAATFHPFSPLEVATARAYWNALQDQVNRVLANPTVWAALEAHQARQAMPQGLADAVAQWDQALDDAEGVYADTLSDFQADWGTWGRYALSWRMWASLTPGLTYAQVMATGRFILAARFACDWTPREAALVAQALLEGWQERISRSALTGLT